MAKHLPRPNISENNLCSFCLSKVPDLKDMKRYGDVVEVPCVCCGKYRITGTAIDVLPHWDLPEALWVAIAYNIKRMTGRAIPPQLDVEVLRALKETAHLPHPDQILDDFVLWFGNQSHWPGEGLDLTFGTHRTLLGAVTPSAFNYMLNCIVGSFLFTGEVFGYPTGNVYHECSMLPAGWARFRELSTSAIGQRYGFMAMKYGDNEIDAVVREHFVPQVKLAGFDLQRLDDGQPAGLIDDQLRVRIRQAKFLVCDLTHGNRGAYWEAGFAEGLGRPVIYTCRRDVFEDSKHEHHPHFDAAHWVTVPWDPSDPGQAAAKLKTIVRATLPSEAKLED